MSGTPPPYPLEPTIGGPRNHFSSNSHRPPTAAGTKSHTPLASSPRLRLPPPLPPVRGTTPFFNTPGALPSPHRPPMGRLAPLPRPTEEGGGRPTTTTTTGVISSETAHRSPPPRIPRAESRVSVPSTDTTVIPGLKHDGENGIGPNDDVFNGPNVLSPQSQKSYPSPQRKTMEGINTPSVRSRKTITPIPNHRVVEKSNSSYTNTEDVVEELCPLQTHTRPVERFFVEYKPKTSGNEGDNDVDMDEDEILFDRLAEYTDDDSFFSSSSSIIEQDPRRLQKDPLRGRAVRSVFDTLNLRALTNGRTPEELEDEERDNAGWMYQVHQRAIALHHSSFFIFPAGMTARVVVYNVMHHWLIELLIILLILAYSIFTASWARYTGLELVKPDFMIFADVFFTVIYGIEILVRLFASGFILHPRAYFRSPWHWLDFAVFVLMVMNCTDWHYLWNFTAFRLIRVIKACTYIPMPIRIKLLAKSLLRSTNKLFQVSVILIYALFFFALMGLQIFRGALHHRCVNQFTGLVTSQLCNPKATGQNWFYMGHVCSEGFTCVTDEFSNPHYDFRSFDDIGHALLSTFHIMTFQGWSNLLQETNDAVNMVAILYYAFTILFCSWFIPSLYVGVFIEKIEKTSRLFVQKQLQLFDNMLLEQRQRMNEAIKLRDFVERDENGKIRRNPLDMLRNDNSNEGNVDSSYTGAGNGSSSNSFYSERDNNNGGGSSGRSTNVRKRTKWTDEQRVQLHLSLTRQRDIAEEAERKRRGILKVTHNGNNNNNPNSNSSGSGSNQNGESTVSSRPTTSNGMGGGDFALGGRVGAVMHHPLSYTIGASHGSKLPLAVRLENEEEQVKFLKHYQNLTDDYNVKNSNGNPTKLNGMNNNNNNNNNNNLSRPPLAITGRRGSGQMEEIAGNILATKESAGVIPNRRSAPRPWSSSGASNSMRNSGAVIHNSAIVTSESQPQQEVLINDPEGGDFRFATTCSQRWAIVRNILHMFTEGYPRILTQYLWEHRRMQRRFGLMPLNYVNKYEEAALRKLRKRRARRGRKNNNNNNNNLDKMDNYSNSNEDEDDDGYSELEEVPIEKNDDSDLTDLSPIRMAKNIVDNAPITVFNAIFLFLIFANGVFNASRHYGQPEYWDDGLFIAGVCFNSLFTLELIIRVIAVGPGPFIFDFFNVLGLIVTIIGFFELGFGRSNAITVLNWVRFLRLFRLAPFTPMRRVARVLLLGFQDIAYSLIFFTIYMFMWLLIGMSFFGSRAGRLDRTNDDYSIRSNFDTFSQAAFAISQGFSYNRVEWLYLSWDGMRARGGYTIMYFLAVVGVAFIFRYFFISVFAWAWQCEEEQEDYAIQGSNGNGNRNLNQGGPRLRWFDFTVWRSFKHIHGGFKRRDVAPDEVFHLNQDMRRQLRIAEAKDRFLRQTQLQRGFSADQRQLSSSSINLSNFAPMQVQTSQPPVVMVPQFVNVGGQLQRHISMQSEFAEAPQPPINAPISQFQAENAQLRFARRYSAVPATAYSQVVSGEAAGTQSPPLMSTMSDVGAQNSNTSVIDVAAQFEEIPPFQSSIKQIGSFARRGSGSTPLQRRSSVTSHFPTLGYDRPAIKRDERSISNNNNNNNNNPMEQVDESHPGSESATGGGIVYEHILFPGPRLRYKHSMVGRRRRLFERCLDCNTHKQMPLRAPPNVQQRTADELHAEHCHMAAVRSSRQLVMNVIMGYVRLQKELGVVPTREAVETVLGQAWSCGMLLFETIEYLSCSDIEAREYRTWDRTLEALQLQQWLIGLHVGEEQVGRATLAYILAHQKTQERERTQRSFKRSWRDRSLFIFLPNHPVRLWVTRIVESSIFEWFIIGIIFAASICLCFYDPRVTDYSSRKYVTLHVLDDIFAVIFGVEMLLKWLSMGVILDFHVAYFWHRWNIFDCFITIISLIAIAPVYTRFRYLKVMRCFRILGPLRHSKFNKELSKLAVTMWDCVPTIANVLLLCLLNYIVWSIMAVRLFMDLTHSCNDMVTTNRTLCELEGNEWIGPQRNFDNFYESLLTMFEISTGSKWLDTIFTGVDGWSTMFAPIKDRHPYKGLFFIAYYYVSNFVFFSLFAATMIYSYLLAKNAAEGVVGITFEHQLWIRMQRMIIKLTPRIQLIPLGNVISRFIHRIVIHPIFEIIMSIVLFFNLITMSLYWYGNNSNQERVLDILQYVWVALFTVEIILRLTAHGIRAFTRWSFCFNLFIMCLSYLQIGLNTTENHKVPFNVNVLRLLYLSRMLKLVDLLIPLRHHLKLLNEVLLLSASSLINVTLILILSVFVFAVLGMHLIGPIIPTSGNFIDNTYNNFLTFPNALMMTFRLTTLEDWVAMLRSSISDGNICDSIDCKTTNWAPVFYVPIVICFALMIVNLYVAVVVDHYVTVVRMNATVTRIQDLRRFCDLWSERDPNATLVLRTKQLPELLESLRPPLGLSSRHNRVELLRLLREYDIPDHAGKVHYHEVLLPLARRVLAMAFSEDEMDDGATFETVWRLSEKSLRALPTVLVHHSNATTAQHFAASYLQAAYRRDKACRQMHQARAELWREGRAVCDELGLPYHMYGFGHTALDDEDPRAEAARRGLSLESAEEKRPPHRTASPSGALSEGSGSTGAPPATRLPGVYQPAIDEKEKRFGPDVPNAVRRHETRSDKLRRKEEERQQIPTDTVATVAPQGQRSSSQRGHSGDYQPPLGTDPSSWLSGEMSRRMSAVGGTVPLNNNNSNSPPPSP